ncbi:ribonuclease HII [Natronoflexus pectinivorans]|uniref:Ribonuclease HII n=1 Tax=Natronoflexus pectinivorans TaxID=682526 RepID=A0A4R2GHL4_9BACT|nr:ribonuclease HII [Natronoflexus pectinivorans]TCO07917.1 RNase HII [Natronoflexus pectinivorans]
MSGKLLKHPLKSSLLPGRLEAGCDEAGRGCLAGPVVAAAVILPDNFSHPFLNDSKQLSHKKRMELREIIEKEAISWAVALVDNEEIDKINILKASILAMHKAVGQLSVKPEFLLIDGNRFYPYDGLSHQCVIKGDATYLSIAAASILAKTHRDELMDAAHEQYPFYGWDKNKGYPTKTHREGITANGISPLHRKTFRLTDGQLSLGL